MLLRPIFILFLAFFILKSHHSYSQNNRFEFGARHIGLGGASVTLEDVYSLNNNIGGLGFTEKTSAYFGYQNRYGLASINTVGGGVVIKTKAVTSGISFFKFGDDAYSMQRIQVGLGHKIENVSFGISMGLVQFNVATVGTRQNFIFDLGGTMKLLPELYLGLNIFNITRATIDTETNERIPTVLKGGLSYRPFKVLMINAEIEKDLTLRELMKFGIEYQIITNVYLRTGITTRPFLNFFGMGINIKQFKIDYAYTKNNLLGSINDVSLSFQFE